MTITSLMDDYCPQRHFHGEHGLSLHIGAGGGSILFDTGQSDAFLKNARELALDLSGIDAIVLSHGHYDHGGGIVALYDAVSPSAPPLYAGSGYDAVRLARNKSGQLDIGLPVPALPEDVPPPVLVDAMKEIAPGIHIMPKALITDGSQPSERLRKIDASDGADAIDDFPDELSLVIVEEDGIAIVTGCAHRGILNIARAAVQAFPGRPIKAIVGGFHLIDLPPESLRRIALDLDSLEPRAVFCSHCTGFQGFAALCETLRAPVAWLTCGMRITV